MYVYILLARNKRTCNSAHNNITIDRNNKLKIVIYPLKTHIALIYNKEKTKKLLHVNHSPTQLLEYIPQSNQSWTTSRCNVAACSEECHMSVTQRL